MVLDVEFDPQGTPKTDLEHNLNQVIRDAVNNGTLTGETAATVEKYHFAVIPLDRPIIDIAETTRIRLGSAFRNATK